MPTVLNKAKTRRNTSALPLGAADEAILSIINRYYVVTALQVAQLLYTSTNSGLRYAQRRLKRLVETGYVYVEDQPKLARYGKAPQVFFLANDGRQFLARMGLEVDRRSRPDAVGKYRFLFYQHTLEANAVGIALERLVRSTDRLELVELRSEHTIKRQPARVTLPTGETTSVYPDAWYDLIEHTDTGERFQTSLALELDRNTEKQAKWRRKVTALLAWSQAPYEALYGPSEALTICVMTTAGQQRCQQLLAWTAAELTERGATDAASLFRFTARTPADTSPATLFCSSVWSMPFESNPTPLLEVAGGTA
jgi:hypothetical protein